MAGAASPARAARIAARRRGSSSLERAHLGGDVHGSEEARGVMGPARVDVVAAHVHDSGRFHVDARARDDVALDGHVVEVVLLHAGGGLHLDEPPAVAGRASEHVHAHEHVVVAKRGFEDRGHRGIAHERRGAVQRLVQALAPGLQGHAAREGLLGALAHLVPLGEEELEPGAGGGGQRGGGELEIEALVALQPRHDAGLGQRVWPRQHRHGLRVPRKRDGRGQRSRPRFPLSIPPGAVRLQTENGLLPSRN